jgi:2-polyprenyl-3-methyl-5-hydroxy-6-metoxy-1,4-benzoquinol methylase
MSKEHLLFYRAYEEFYSMAEKSEAFRMFCEDAFGADFSQDGFSDRKQIDYILSLFPQKEELSILDIGCGNGKMLNYLQRKTGGIVYGFDYSENAINQARHNHIERSNFEVGVIGEIDYEPEKFDVIISMDTMYFAKDMNQFVSQIRKWLKSDGVFIVGYQEGDVVPKTVNSKTTLLAKALESNHMNYQVKDITEDVYNMLKRKRETIIKYKKLFYNESLRKWYKIILHQTNCITVPISKYIENNARYLYLITK